MLHLKFVTFILLGIFAIVSFALAQEPSLYDQDQYQQQFSPQQNQYQGEPQETPLSLPPAESQQETILSPEKSSPTKETPPQVQPQETSPETPLSENVTDQKSARQLNLSSPIAYLTYAVVVVLVFFWFGEWLRRWLKRRKKIELPSEAEETKPPTEAEKSEEKTKPPAEAEKIVCPTCGGTGKVTKKRTKTAPCNHCKQTGIDICHYCGGTGRNGLGYGVPLEDIENYPKCDYCGGKGFPELVLPCEFCKGERKIEYQESYEETCPTCKGSGRVPK